MEPNLDDKCADWAIKEARTLSHDPTLTINIVADNVWSWM